MKRTLPIGLVVLAAYFSAYAAEPSTDVVPTPNLSLIENGGFENPAAVKGQPPAGWRFYTTKLGIATVATNIAKEGTHSFRLRAQGIGGAACGVVQTIAVTAGNKYSVSAWIRKNDDDLLKGTAYGQLVIEWQDADANEISRSWGKKWGPNTGHAKWEEVDIKKAEAPPKCVQAIFGIHLYDGKSGSKGSVFVDEVSVTSP